MLSSYTTQFAEYPADLVAFATQHNITLPSLSGLRGQGLALMAQPDIRGKVFIGREEADQFFKTIGIETRDSIQGFNKATGLKRMNKRGYYCLVYPYECDKTDIDKRIGVSVSGDRDENINKIKDFWRKNLVDVPNKDWQIGHLDPTIADASESNLALQPPIQGKYRNRFKWDEWFMKMWPTTSELLPHFNKYYTEDEQRAIYDELKKKFEK